MRTYHSLNCLSASATKGKINVNFQYFNKYLKIILKIPVQHQQHEQTPIVQQAVSLGYSVGFLVPKLTRSDSAFVVRTKQKYKIQFCKYF